MIERGNSNPFGWKLRKVLLPNLTPSLAGLPEVHQLQFVSPVAPDGSLDSIRMQSTVQVFANRDLVAVYDQATEDGSTVGAVHHHVADPNPSFSVGPPVPVFSLLLL